MEKGNIKQIDRTSVHKICSGQVVLTLATAVKELVENSIDAGATTIDVKLKEYGSEFIEVIDNGKGVKKSDFQNLTLKHHTSKIEDFSDLPFVSTFGFRGEALSSLCALSDLEITTCHCDASIGSVLTFDNDGNLTKCSPIARQAGTTVTLKNLFYTLPVRHKEFLRNIRREYFKMLHLLTAYCLISTNKRISCTNITDKGKKNIVLSTNNSQNFKDNIICIFGAKQMSSLMEIVQHLPSEEILEEYFLPVSDMDKSIFNLEGYISNSTHGEGRSTTDRQFFYINGRPCDLPKVAKLINEVYHSFNRHQYPFVFVNISLTEGSADVNVTPDKRQIFIPNEKLLLAIVKTSLLQMYGIQPSQMKVSSLNFSLEKKKTGISFSELSSIETNCEKTSDSFLKRRFDFNSDYHEEDEASSQPFKTLRKDEEEACGEEQAHCSGSSNQQKPETSSVPDRSSVSHLTNTTNNKELSPPRLQNSNSQFVGNVNFTVTLPFREERYFKNSSPNKNRNNKFKEMLLLARRDSDGSPPCTNPFSNKKLSKTKVDLNKTNDKIVNFFNKQPKIYCEYEQKRAEGATVQTKEFKSTMQTEEFKAPLQEVSIEKLPKETPESKIPSKPLVDEPLLRRKRCKIIPFDMDLLKKELQNKDSMCSDTTECSYRKFRSKILPTENNNAEEELNREINKEDFSRMEIIGQFNLGFIITQLNNDLFIIDQHATDEKYNFECLQKETVLETQKLLNPLNLNLTAASEATLMDNLHIFEKNGFKFSIDEDNFTGNKVQLVSVPMSKNWSFGKEDVDEMIFMLTDNPARMVRPSRINQMFASRACRKSVMIGTSLTIPMMKKLVMHMGEIEQPWNCPHGRPTMRHLFNLNLLQSS